MRKSPRIPVPEVDCRNFRLKKINQPEYRHMWLLLFWPVYWLRYPIVEWFNSVDRCHLIHCVLDEHIPFLEGFIVPYGLWLWIMLGLNLYMCFYDVEAFKKYTKFLILTLSASTLIFFIYPSYQDLRPAVFPRDNIFTRWVGMIYAADTCTNVMPSEHVIGSFAFWAGCLHCRTFRKKGRMVIITVLAVLTAISTVFLKQHSVLDVLGAVPVCLAAYWYCYGRNSCK